MSNRSVGRPKLDKDTINPNLRIDTELWKRLKEKYPRQVNKMFTKWVTEMLLDNN